MGLTLYTLSIINTTLQRHRECLLEISLFMSLATTFKLFTYIHIYVTLLLKFMIFKFHKSIQTALFSGRL